MSSSAALRVHQQMAWQPLPDRWGSPCCVRRRTASCPACTARSPAPPSPSKALLIFLNPACLRAATPAALATDGARPQGHGRWLLHARRRRDPRPGLRLGGADDDDAGGEPGRACSATSPKFSVAPRDVPNHAWQRALSAGLCAQPPASTPWNLSGPRPQPQPHPHPQPQPHPHPQLQPHL
jgi:hypothetical protein